MSAVEAKDGEGVSSCRWSAVGLLSGVDGVEANTLCSSAIHEKGEMPLHVRASTALRQ